MLSVAQASQRLTETTEAICTQVSEALSVELLPLQHNQERIQEETILLNQSIQKCYQESAAWQGQHVELLMTCQTSLSSIPEWSKTIERDLHQIATALEYIWKEVQCEETNES